MGAQPRRVRAERSRVFGPGESRRAAPEGFTSIGPKRSLGLR
ncbi:hypothetical protein HMPREF0591_4373, partial [Mycobacterium parascrofulaceum ATCC BAA-614]